MLEEKIHQPTLTACQSHLRSRASTIFTAARKMKRGSAERQGQMKFAKHLEDAANKLEELKKEKS